MTDAERRELVRCLRDPSDERDAPLRLDAADEIERLVKQLRKAERERNEALEELRLWKLQG